MTNPGMSQPGARGVFLLFLIPVVGGIPGGVLLAKARGIGWPTMEILYFISDVILAFTFEPILRGILILGRRFQFFSKAGWVVRETVRRGTARYGSAAGPLALVMIAFGVDPMTGRAAAHAAGHGFVTGWMIAITGDMMYFTVIMVCTLWLGALIGDGTLATFIILALMFLVPAGIRKWRERRGR